MSFHSEVIGSGSYLPDRLVTNDDLAKVVDTSDEWIVERTGIRQRHLAADGELTSDLALQASRRALQAAGAAAGDVDAIVLATTTPDETFPATATKLQAALGMTRGIAFDLQAVCSGFIYALAMADNMIRLGQARTILVVGAETFSRLLDWTDRGTCVLFGDGAGAFVLRAVAGGPETIRRHGRGLISTHLYADGRQHDILYTNGGVSSTRTAGTVKMAGKEVFKFAVANMAAVAAEALAGAGLTEADLDWLVPHQANKRIIDATARKLHLPEEKVVYTVGQHANTSAASIPLAFDVAVRDGRIRRGQLVMLESMGAGMTWGASLLRL